MEKRTFVNPAMNNTATFIKTSKETNGKHTHPLVVLVNSDSSAPGWMSLLSPFIRLVAKRAKNNGTEKWLVYSVISIKSRKATTNIGIANSEAGH